MIAAVVCEGISKDSICNDKKKTDRACKGGAGADCQEMTVHA